MLFRSAQPSPAVLYASYPVSWTVTAAFHAAFFFFIRKHAYAKAQGIQSLSKDAEVS